MSGGEVDPTSNPCAVCRRDGHSTKDTRGAWVCPLVVDGTISAEAAEDALAVKELLVNRIHSRNPDMTFNQAYRLIKTHQTWGYTKPDGEESDRDLSFKLPNEKDLVIKSLERRLDWQGRALRRFAGAFRPGGHNSMEDAWSFDVFRDPITNITSTDPESPEVTSFNQAKRAIVDCVVGYDTKVSELQEKIRKSQEQVREMQDAVQAMRGETRKMNVVLQEINPRSGMPIMKKEKTVKDSVPQEPTIHEDDQAEGGHLLEI
jgi:hypothetical protein